jgi:hypothetical protein
LLEEEPIHFGKCHLEVDHDWTKLVNENGYKLYSIETGVLNTLFEIPPEFDYRLFGFSISTLSKNGVFDQYYSASYKSRNQLLSMLDDLIVPKPEISEVTKERLGLSGNWGDRYEEKIPDEEEDVDFNFDDFLDEVINFDVQPEDFIVPKDDDWNLDEFITFLTTTDAILSFKTTEKTRSARQTFLMLKYLKYDIISRMILPDGRINKEMIGTFSEIKFIHSKNFMLYSLISFYDRTYYSTGEQSPKHISTYLNDEFLSKFKVREIDPAIRFD